MKLKRNIVNHNNNIWEYSYCASYYIYETNNNCFIYRLGGKDSEILPNIEYSVSNDVCKKNYH